MIKLFRRAAFALVILAILAFVSIDFYADKLVRKSIEKVGPVLTKVEVRVEDADLSLLSGRGSVNGLTVGNPEGYKSPHAVKVSSARITLKPASLLERKVVIREINVQAPEITFETDFKGNNLSRILANIEETTVPVVSKLGKKLQVDSFRITNARMKVALTLLGGRSVTVPLPDIHLQNMGQGPEGITTADLLRQVFAAIESSAVKSAATATENAGTEAVKSAAEQVKKGVGSLFKK